MLLLCEEEAVSTRLDLGMCMCTNREDQMSRLFRAPLTMSSIVVRCFFSHGLSMIGSMRMSDVNS